MENEIIQQPLKFQQLFSNPFRTELKLEQR